MKNDGGCNGRLSENIDGFLKNTLKVAGRDPAQAKFVLQTLRRQAKAARIRAKHDRQGLQVPPYMFISVTNRCNLNCAGCYSRAQHRPAGRELDDGRLRSAVAEAVELGISFIFLAGGEPLMRPGALDIAGEFPQAIFPLFTNGLLLTDGVIERLRHLRNVIPVVSLEGDQAATDLRRGAGIYERLRGTLEKMRDAGLLFGLSFTVTRHNFSVLTDEAFIAGMTEAGPRLFFYVEYIPVDDGTEALVVTGEQRAALRGILDAFREKLPGLFVSFPGDEESFGGCLSAGRGFIHISADGDLEPCPFAPYSDANLRDMSLKEALGSDLLRSIRENHKNLTETRGGCALWEKRGWVESLLPGGGK